MRCYLRAKLHRARVTEANVHQVGSITIDQDLVDEGGLSVEEKVRVGSNDSGARLESYVNPGAGDSGAIGFNGAAAHLIRVGQDILLMGFKLSDEPIEAKVIVVDENNRFSRAS